MSALLDFARAVRDLMPWWRGRRQECLRDGAWYQNDLDRADLDLRRKIAPFMQQFYPSNSTCSHCHWPWGFVREHTLNYTEFRGCFAVCDWCYLRLMSEGQHDLYRSYYHELRQSWLAQSRPGDEIVSAEVLDAAIERERESRRVKWGGEVWVES